MSDRQYDLLEIARTVDAMKAESDKMEQRENN